MKQCLCMLTLILVLCACTASPAAVSDSADVSGSVREASETVQSALEDPSVQPATSNFDQEDIVETLPEISSILEAVVYDENNFVTEQEFYRALADILACYQIEMSPCPDDSADFVFLYDNITSVKLLTLGSDKQEVAEDIRSALEQHSQKQDALDAGSLEDAQYLGISKDLQYDNSRNPLESQDLVVAFILASTASQEDQSLFYMVSAAAYAILHPDYTSDTAAFEDLKQNLFSFYANNTADADYVSWINRVSTTEKDASLTIPGNALECWFGTKADRSLWLDITPYIYYEKIIDVAVTVG